MRIHLIGTLLLLIGSAICSATVQGQDEPMPMPKPKPVPPSSAPNKSPTSHAQSAAGGPSLRDTMAFVTYRLNLHEISASAAIQGGGHYWLSVFYRDVSGSDCTLNYTIGFKHSTDVVSFADYSPTPENVLVTVKRSLYLRQGVTVSDEPVRLNSADYGGIFSSQFPLYVIRFSFRVAQSYQQDRIVTKRDGTTASYPYSTSNDEAVLVAESKDDALKLRNAVNHAIKLCGGLNASF